MRKTFFEALGDIIKNDENIFLLTADLGVKFLDNLRDIDPKRFINVGIAESNMIGLAAGLAMSGKNVYCYSIIPFLVMRGFEQIRIDLCYNNLNVKLLGAGGGMVYGAEGVTHHAIEDMAIMRSLPNMTVVAPGDAVEAKFLARASYVHQGPLYVRFARDTDPVIHPENIDFKIGKGIIAKQGKDCCIIATGTMLYIAQLVVDILEKNNVSPALISMHTIKPMDDALLRDCAKNHKAIFTLEEHNIIGGLGSAVSETLAEFGYSGIFKRIGIKDAYSSVVGGPDYLRQKSGLGQDEIAKTILKILQ